MALKSWSSSANEKAITAVNSPGMINKRQTKKTAPTIMQTKVANSSYSSFKLAIFMPEPEKHKQHQTLNQKLPYASDSDMNVLQRVIGFWIGKISSCQFLKTRLEKKSNFEGSIVLKNQILKIDFLWKLDLKKTCIKKNHVLYQFTP